MVSGGFDSCCCQQSNAAIERRAVLDEVVDRGLELENIWQPLNARPHFSTLADGSLSGEAPAKYAAAGRPAADP